MRRQARSGASAERGAGSAEWEGKRGVWSGSSCSSWPHAPQANCRAAESSSTPSFPYHPNMRSMRTVADSCGQLKMRRLSAPINDVTACQTDICVHEVGDADSADSCAPLSTKTDIGRVRSGRKRGAGGGAGAGDGGKCKMGNGKCKLIESRVKDHPRGLEIVRGHA
jgi:hypothetical protein